MGLKDFLRSLFHVEAKDDSGVGLKIDSDAPANIEPQGGGHFKVGIGRPTDLPQGKAEIFVQVQFKFKDHMDYEKNVMKNDSCSPWEYLFAGNKIAVFANTNMLGVIDKDYLGEGTEANPIASMEFRAILDPGTYTLFAVPAKFTSSVKTETQKQGIAGSIVYPWTSSPIYYDYTVVGAMATEYASQPLVVDLEGETWNAVYPLTFVEGDSVSSSRDDKAEQLAKVVIPAPVKVGDVFVKDGKVWVALQNGMEATGYKTLDEYNKAVAIKQVKVELIPVGLPDDPAFVPWQHDPTKLLLELPSTAMGGKNTVFELNFQYVKFTGAYWWIHTFRGIKTLANLGWDNVAPSYEIDMFDVKQELGKGNPPVPKPKPAQPIGAVEVAKAVEKGETVAQATAEAEASGKPVVPYVSAYNLDDYYRHINEGYNDADAKYLAIQDKKAKERSARGFGIT